MLLVSKHQVEEFKTKSEKYYQSVIDNPVEFDSDSWRHIGNFLSCMLCFGLIEPNFYRVIGELRAKAFIAYYLLGAVALSQMHTISSSTVLRFILYLVSLKLIATAPIIPRPTHKISSSHIFPHILPQSAAVNKAGEANADSMASSTTQRMLADTVQIPTVT